MYRPTHFLTYCSPLGKAFFRNSVCEVFNTEVHHSHDGAKVVLVQDLKEEIQYPELLKFIKCSVIGLSVILKSCSIKVTGKTFMGVNWSNEWSLKYVTFFQLWICACIFSHQLQPKESVFMIDVQFQLGKHYFICTYLIKLQRHLIKSRQIWFSNITVCQKVMYSYSFYSADTEK